MTVVMIMRRGKEDTGLALILFEAPLLWINMNMESRQSHDNLRITKQRHS